VLPCDFLSVVEATYGGLGSARKRKEDIRFVQGKGNYVDNLKLSGMLFGDFVRSQYGHARIKSIDTSKAKALPGVHAVLTAEDLKPLNLHYMPTRAGDVQMVLAYGRSAPTSASSTSTRTPARPGSAASMRWTTAAPGSTPW
jgi:CO/xanthine dehydrogenase Mo-binding subunit